MDISVPYWLLTLLALLPFYSTANATPTKVVVYADDAYPPYSYAVVGEPKGVYTEILKLIFSKMKSYDVTIKPIPWKRGLKLLQLGKGFALYPPYYYSDKRLYISPYSDPILPEEVVVYCNPETADKRTLENWPEDFYGLTIGINEAFALGGDEFWAAVDQQKIFTLSAKGNKASLVNLYERQTDCYINDRLSILWDIKNLKMDGTFPNDWMVTLSTVVSREHGHLGFTNQYPEQYPYKDDFVTQFNQQLKQLQQDGTIDQVLSRYFQPYR
tara:strand:+ start:2394 stop:3206 length:813 start_codon:yes stop_codon:yes gene_type:complete